MTLPDPEHMNRPFPSRKLGDSAVEVAELGLGCNRIGEKGQTDREWMNLLERAADLGITVFDTAAMYAGGRSEELIGKTFGNRANVLIASKVSPVNGSFSKKTVIEGAENSLRMLRRDCIDIFQTHGSGELTQIRDPEWAEAMDELQSQGKIRFRGAAVFHAEGAVYAIEQGLVDVLQITYNLLDTGHAMPILPVAEKHGVGLLARMPYQRGILTGKFSPGVSDPADHRARLQGERFYSDVRNAEKFRELGEKRPGGMTALAMQYVLAEPRLSCTIPGARSIAQLEANVAAALAPPLTREEALAVSALGK